MVGVDDEARPLRAGILLRRGCTIGGVVVRRAAAAGWHTTLARVRHEQVDEAKTFRRELRRALEDLGPTFVKLGQLLSARSDVIPPRLQRERKRVLPGGVRKQVVTKGGPRVAHDLQRKSNLRTRR